MTRASIILCAMLALVAPLGTADAQIDAGRWYFSPHFGLTSSSDLTSGVNFGLATSYMMSQRWGFGPYLQFTTAGRQFESGEGFDTLKTESSNTLTLGGRFSYHLREGSDTTWRLHVGASWLRMSAISSFKNGLTLAFDTPGPGVNLVPGEIQATTAIAGTFGLGTFLPMTDKVRIALDLNFSASQLDAPSGATLTGAQIDLSDRFDSSLLWLTEVTIGFHMGR